MESIERCPSVLLAFENVFLAERRIVPKGVVTGQWVHFRGFPVASDHSRFPLHPTRPCLLRLLRQLFLLAVRLSRACPAERQCLHEGARQMKSILTSLFVVELSFSVSRSPSDDISACNLEVYRMNGKIRFLLFSSSRILWNTHQLCWIDGVFECLDEYILTNSLLLRSFSIIDCPSYDKSQKQMSQWSSMRQFQPDLGKLDHHW